MYLAGNRAYFSRIFGLWDGVFGVQYVFETVQGRFGFANGIGNRTEFFDRLVAHIERGQNGGDDFGLNVFLHRDVQGETQCKGRDELNHRRERFVVFDRLEGEGKKLAACR